METAISTFCKSLSSFCHHVQTSSQALLDSIQRRPLPLDSAASTFLQCLDRRVSSTGTDLNLLESMAFGTVSVEELLGHCNEVYKMNDKYISDLENRMQAFGYVPELELEDEANEDLAMHSKYMSPDTRSNGMDRLPVTCGSVSVMRSSRKRLEDDALFEDSVSLQNLGLSDAGLATLSSAGNDSVGNPMVPSSTMMSLMVGQQCGEAMTMKTLKNVMSTSDIVKDDPFKVGSASQVMIKTSKADYDSLPSYMKSLASWEELQEAVVKMNSYLCRDTSNNSSAFHQDDLEKMGLGPKGRSYLLLLLRMNQLVLEAVDGSTVYHLRA